MDAELSTSGSSSLARTRMDGLWRIAAVVFIGLYLFLRWMHNFTELTPAHENVNAGLGLFDAVAAIAIFIAVVWFSRDRSTAKRFLSGVVASVAGFFIVGLLSDQAASLIEGWIDFPPSQTVSHAAQLPIHYAYTSHGRGGDSWHIQITHGVEMKITHSDYDFMTRTRILPGDGSDLGNVAGRDGYFCVSLTMQQSGKAVRVMHPFFGTLPLGSVQLCTTDPSPTP